MIEEYIAKYKSITEAIIVNLKNGLTGQELLDKRSGLLKSLLENKDFNKEDIKRIYIESGAENLDKMLRIQLDKSREKIRGEIRTFEARKIANSAYGKNINSINTFNKKI